MEKIKKEPVWNLKQKIIRIHLFYLLIKFIFLRIFSTFIAL